MNEAQDPNAPMRQIEKADLVKMAKETRQELDAVLQNMKQRRKQLIASRATECEDHGEAIAQATIAIRDAESAIMRMGMVLKNVGNPNPYPESYNPDSPKVEPTADGLKL